MGVRTFACAAMALLLPAAPRAAEVTVKNDSLTDFSAAVIVAGFVANEKASAWLTSPCNGNVRAAQVFWRSGSAGSGQTFGRSIQIARGGTFPTPGAVQQTIEGPVLTDSDLINEFRFLDENSSIPVNVPVTQNETFVVSFEFDAATPGTGPSVVRDVDGCQAGRNGLFAIPPGFWFSSCSLGVSGDWVIRAVIDCGVAPASADLSIAVTAGSAFYTPGAPVNYTIVVSNAGPSAVNNTSVTDTFPSVLGNVSWSCSTTGGAQCPVPIGSGNIVIGTNLPAGSTVTIQATGIVLTGTTGPITNSAGAFPPAGITDPNLANNLAAVTVNLQQDPVFANGFEN